MNTRITLIAALAAVMTLGSCKIEIKEEKEYAQADCISESRDISAYKSIDVARGTVIYTYSETPSLTVTAPKEVIEYVQIVNHGDQLLIFYNEETPKRKTYSLFGKTYLPNSEMITIHLQGPTPELVTLNSSSTFESQDTLCVKTFEARILGSGLLRANGIKSETDVNLKVSGSGDIKMGKLIAGNNVAINVVGSGDIEIDNGMEASETASITISGSGDVDCKNISTPKTTLTVCGSGDIDAHFKNCPAVKATIAGSGDIELSGHYENVSKTVSGSGDISEK